MLTRILNVHLSSVRQMIAQNGQSALRPLCQLEMPVVARFSDLLPRYRFVSHQHPWGQVCFASDGILTVVTPDGLFVVPPQRALWIPSAVSHEVSCWQETRFRSLYLDDSYTSDLPAQVVVLGVDQLLREMILHAPELEHSETTAQDAYIRFLVYLLQRQQRPALHLPVSLEPRLQRLLDALLHDPADNRPVTAWADWLGLSARSLSRLLIKETGLNFNQWRQRLRMLLSLALLEQGQSVTEIALTLGYESASAFIAMFRRQLGTTPGAYLREIRPTPDNTA